MDTATLQGLLDFYHPDLKAVVCAKDQLYTFRPRRRAYIVNTDPISKRGRHWVCIYYSDNIAYYFDSYGSYNLIEPEINTFLSSTCKWSYRNRSRFQSDYTDYCGVYCLFALNLMASQNGSFIALTQRTFSATDWINNDARILQWFLKREHKYAHTAETFTYQTCAAKSSGGVTLLGAL